jgi:hypothetical protein
MRLLVRDGAGRVRLRAGEIRTSPLTPSRMQSATFPTTAVARRSKPPYGGSTSDAFWGRLCASGCVVSRAKLLRQDSSYPFAARAVSFPSLSALLAPGPIKSAFKQHLQAGVPVRWDCNSPRFFYFRSNCAAIIREPFTQIRTLPRGPGSGRWRGRPGPRKPEPRHSTTSNCYVATSAVFICCASSLRLANSTLLR